MVGSGIGTGGMLWIFVALCTAFRVAGRVQLGIDITAAISVGDMQCLQGEGLYFTTRIFEAAQGGQCDPYGAQNLRTAAGIGYSSAAHAYIQPDPQAMVSGTLSPQEQVQMAVSCGNSVGLDSTRYAINVIQDPTHPWPECSTANGYVIDMIKELWHYSDIVTIFTSKDEWVKVTCQGDPLDARTIDFTARLHAAANDGQKRGMQNSSQNASLDAADLESRPPLPTPSAATPSISAAAGTRYGDRERNILRLWYLSWDGDPNFDDFVPFGPFKAPYAKQYAHKRHICGIACNDDVDSSSSVAP